MLSKRIGLLTFLLVLMIPCVSLGQSTPYIGNLGSGCDNWDCIWIVGSGFQSDSRVYIYTQDWSAYQILWGPAWGAPAGIWVASDGSAITLQVTDSTVRNSFGNAGVHVLVVNSTWTTSNWASTQSPPPVTTGGDAGCDDLYCIWMTGYFPLNMTVDFRPHGQSSVLPNSYSGLHVTPTIFTLALNSSVHYTYDTVGLDAWAVNALFPNWSGGYYLPPKDRSVIGHVDDVVVSGSQYYLRGWACAKTHAASINVQVFVGGPSGIGTYVFNGTANQSSEPAVGAMCNLTGSAYRFSLPIPSSVLQYGNQKIYVYGISPFSLGDPLLGNSGNLLVPVGSPPAQSKEYIYIGDRVLAVDTTNLP